jgi:hypothetical protein
MTDERKNALGEAFLRPASIDPAALAELTIAELRFLVHAAEYFITANALPEGALTQKLPVFRIALIEKIKTADALFIAYDEATETPYIDPDGQMWLFSEADAALAAQEHYAQTVPLLIRKVIRDEIAGAFAELHTMGIAHILLDNGLDSVALRRDDILPPPDWSSTPAANVPVTNPQLMFAMLRFFQTLYAKDNGEDRPQRLSALEEDMLREVVAAKYLVPMRTVQADPATLGKGDGLQFAQLKGADNEAFQPAFTDWIEFRKAFDQNEWGGYIATYDDLLTLSRNLSGVVINCNGTPVKIDANNRERIEAFRGKK